MGPPSRLTGAPGPWPWGGASIGGSQAAARDSTLDRRRDAEAAVGRLDGGSQAAARDSTPDRRSDAEAAVGRPPSSRRRGPARPTGESLMRSRLTGRLAGAPGPWPPAAGRR